MKSYFLLLFVILNILHCNVYALEEKTVLPFYDSRYSLDGLQYRMGYLQIQDDLINGKFLHSGVDFEAAVDAEVTPCRSGKILSSPKTDSYDSTVYIEDSSGKVWEYTHLSKISDVAWAEGKTLNDVDIKQPFAKIRDNGGTPEAHLHLALSRYNPNVAYSEQMTVDNPIRLIEIYLKSINSVIDSKKPHFGTILYSIVKKGNNYTFKTTNDIRSYILTFDTQGNFISSTLLSLFDVNKNNQKIYYLSSPSYITVSANVYDEINNQKNCYNENKYQISSSYLKVEELSLNGQNTTLQFIKKNYNTGYYIAAFKSTPSSSFYKAIYDNNTTDKSNFYYWFTYNEYGVPSNNSNNSMLFAYGGNTKSYYDNHSDKCIKINNEGKYRITLNAEDTSGNQAEPIIFYIICDKRKGEQFYKDKLEDILN